MAIRNRVYVARKECGCIVAAFPVNMDKAIKSKILEQLSKAGYDIEQTSDTDVCLNFALTCDHNKPPLLAYMDSRTKEGAINATIAKEELGIDTEAGVDQADVDAAGTDLEPEAEEAEAQIAAEEAKAEDKPIDHQAEADNLLSDFLDKKAEEAKAEDKPIDHQAEADNLLSNFLDKKDEEEDDDDDEANAD